MATQQAVQSLTVEEEAVTRLSQGVFDEKEVATLSREALNWSALNGLLVGDAQGEVRPLASHSVEKGLGYFTSHSLAASFLPSLRLVMSA